MLCSSPNPFLDPLRSLQHCILNKGRNIKADEEIDLMNDISVLQDLLITKWTAQSSYAVTQVLAITSILFFDTSLFGYAALLYSISKLLSLCEDWIFLREQDHFNEINFQKEESFSQEEEITWSKSILAGEKIVTMTFAAYSHFMPVLFLYIALKACTSDSEGNDVLALSSAMASCVFFFLACYATNKQHGNTEYMIKNCFHGYKVIKFDKDSGGDVFTKDTISSYQAERPKVTCYAKGKNMTLMEAVGYGFTVVAIIGLIVTFSVVVKAGIDVTSQGSASDTAEGSSALIGTNSVGQGFCDDVTITCSHVPDDGSYSSFTTGAHFSVTEGCTLDKSAADLLRVCADHFVALENETEEDIEYDDEDEDSDDVAAEDAAIADFGAEVLATASASNTDVGGSIVIAASYQNWRNAKHTFQQVFTVDGVANSEVSSRRRRLSGSSDAKVTAKDHPTSTVDVDEYGDQTGGLHTYDVTFTVGTGRFDASKDHISASLVGSNGYATKPVSIGNKFAKGEVRKAQIVSSVDIGTVTSIELVSSGKDGLKFSKVEIGSTHEGAMKGYTKCRGSKKKGTWNCLGVVNILAKSGGTCIAECDPDLQPSVPTLSSIVTFDSSSSDIDKLNYPFGEVWNSCSAAGPMKFTYDAKCDTGCEARAHSFKIPAAVEAGFDSDAKAKSSDKGGCQQDSTAAYPEWCLEPLVMEAPWNMKDLR